LNVISRTRKGRAEAGVALLAVMCTMTVLVLVAVTFSGSVQIETRTAVYSRDAAQAHAFAIGGIQTAIFEIAYPAAIDQEDRPRLWTEGQRWMEVPYAQGKAIVEIVNESGKIDLNAAGPEQLMRLFEVRGLDAEHATSLASAIVHWRSPAVPSDDQEREWSGLEAYYREAGYPAAHAPFRSVEEVLRVRGMTRDIYYGTVEFLRGRAEYKYGVGQELTIYSSSPTVNINYASEAVLRSVPGVTPALAEWMIRERSKEPFKSMYDLTQRLTSSLPPEALPFLDTTSSRFFSIVATGELKNSRVRRSVKAVVQLAPDGQARHRLIGWYDDEVPE
jgi:general secretion pathway protein K